MYRHSNIFVKALVWALFVAATSAVGVIEDRPLQEEPYQEANEVDNSAFIPDDGFFSEVNAYWNKKLFLNKLMQSLEGQDFYSNSINSKENANEDWSDEDVKNTSVKRWVSALSSNAARGAKPLHGAKQRKWKTKKGKGTPLLCYFKLCYFRSAL